MARICSQSGVGASRVRMTDLPLVYVVGTPDLKYVKIGKTVNIKNRLNNLQSGCPFPINLWIGIRTQFPSKIEKLLHRKLRKYALVGEWFSLPDDQLDWLSAYCERQNKITKGRLDALLQA